MGQCSCSVMHEEDGRVTNRGGTAADRKHQEQQDQANNDEDGSQFGAASSTHIGKSLSEGKSHNKGLHNMFVMTPQRQHSLDLTPTITKDHQRKSTAELQLPHDDPRGSNTRHHDKRHHHHSSHPHHHHLESAHQQQQTPESGALCQREDSDSHQHDFVVVDAVPHHQANLAASATLSPHSILSPPDATRQLQPGGGGGAMDFVVCISPPHQPQQSPEASDADDELSPVDEFYQHSQEQSQGGCELPDQIDLPDVGIDLSLSSICYDGMGEDPSFDPDYASHLAILAALQLVQGLPPVAHTSSDRPSEVVPQMQPPPMNLHNLMPSMMLNPPPPAMMLNPPPPSMSLIPPQTHEQQHQKRKSLNPSFDTLFIIPSLVAKSAPRPIFERSGMPPPAQPNADEHHLHVPYHVPLIPQHHLLSRNRPGAKKGKNNNMSNNPLGDHPSRPSSSARHRDDSYSSSSSCSNLSSSTSSNTRRLPRSSIMLKPQIRPLNPPTGVDFLPDLSLDEHRTRYALNAW